MKRVILLITVVIYFIIVGCKKDAEPYPKNYPLLSIKIPEVTDNGVSLSAQIFDAGEYTIEEYGFVVSKTKKPVLDDNNLRSEHSLDNGNFNNTINSGLEKGITYNVRAYLKSGKYLVYSNQESFVSNGSLSPEIKKFTPQRGFAGQKIEIEGKNFGYIMKDITVKFGDAEVNIDSISNDVIYIKSPTITKSGDVKISVSVAGMTAVSQDSYHVLFSWMRKKDYVGDGIHSALYLSIHNKGLMIGGDEYNSDLYASGPLSQKVWMYDPIDDSWTRKGDTPFIPYQRGEGFVINNVAYIACVDDKTIYKYTEETDSWSAETEYPGSGKVHSNFVLDNSVYVGVGNRYGFYKEFYKYNSITKEWSQIPDFPGGQRAEVITFSINGKGYVGMGYDLYRGYNDLWEYSPVTNTWSEKNKFPGGSRSMAITFILDSKAYVGLGSLYDNFSGFSDVWEYQINSDTWIRKDDYIGGGKWDNIVFTLNNKVYIGMGAKSYGGGSSWGIFRSYKDLWEFNPNQTK
jgi:N-acetylneuraminic acid mutarotase